MLADRINYEQRITIHLQVYDDRSLISISISFVFCNSIWLRCQADELKISAQQQALPSGAMLETSKNREDG
jgi:hypothetical protein